MARKMIKQEPPPSSSCDCESAASSSSSPPPPSPSSSRSPSPPSSSAQHTSTTIPSTNKRPAGRTKFHETRHPVFRGGRWRWVCEVRVPGRRGCRLWLGTFAAAEHAARAHDAAMLALRGGASTAAALNFPDSAWLLDVPPALVHGGADDVRRAVAVAVERFLLRARSAAAAAEDAMSAAEDLSAAAAETETETETEASSSSSSGSGFSDDAREEASPFELDMMMMSDMGAGLYYASLAQGLLMEPPPLLDEPCGGDDGDCELAGVALWSY